jgi:hypothetical protein
MCYERRTVYASAQGINNTCSRSHGRKLGIAVVRFGLPVLIAVGIIAVIAALRNDR